MYRLHGILGGANNGEADLSPAEKVREVGFHRRRKFETGLVDPTPLRNGPMNPASIGGFESSSLESRQCLIFR